MPSAFEVGSVLHRLAPSLGLLALRATVVLLAAAALWAAFRRASASARHAVLGLAVLALLVLPALTFVLPRLELPILSVPPSTTPEPAAPQVLSFVVPSDLADDAPASWQTLPAAAAASPTRQGAPSRPVVSISAALAALWLVGAAAGVTQIAVSAWLVRRIARRAVPVQQESWRRWLAEAAAHLGLTRPVRLVISPSVAVPVVWGFARGVVMLPSDAVAWPEDRARAFLIHELAHVRRHDCLLLTLANVARALYWPHPLVWWAVLRLRSEAERACDDRVLATGTAAPDYAQHLLEAARGVARMSRPLAVLAVAERGSFEDRLLALLDPGLRRAALTPRVLVFSAVTAAAFAGAVGVMQPVARAVAAQITPPASAPAVVPPATASPLPTPRPRPTGVRLEGVVKDASGKAVDKALVIVWPEPTPTGHVEAETARTDATGAFRLDPARRAASYKLRIEAPGLVAYVANGAKPGAPLTVKLDKGLTLAGRVLDETTKKPLSGARVKARPADDYSSAPVSEPDAGWVLATTGPDGRYLLEGLESTPYRVSAAAPAHTAADTEAVPGHRVADLLLSPGGSIGGGVTDDEDRPVAGASVVAASELPFSGVAPSPAVTDAAGRFAILGLAPGSYRVTATADRFAAVTDPAVDVEEAQETPLDLRIGKAHRLRGRLVDADGRPVEGDVWVQELDGVAPVRALGPLRGHAAEDGRFTLDGVPRGSHALAVQPQGFPLRQHDVVVAGKEATLDLGDIVLDLGLVIAGRVRDRAGAGVASSAMVAGRDRTYVRGLSRADGTFRLAGLETGTYSLTARADGFAALPQDVEAGTTSAEVVLDKGGAITARVTDDAGRPVPAASAQVGIQPPRSGLGSNRRRADGSGRIRVDGLVAGTYIMDVYAEGYMLHSTPKLAVVAGGTADAGTIVLSQGGSLRGIVVDGRGETVAGAEVSASGRGLQSFTPTRFRGGSRGTKTGVDGRFEMPGLPNGTFEVKASHRRYAPAEAVKVAVEAGAEAQAVTLVLRDGGRIMGTARRRDGAALSDAFVTVRDPGRPGFDAPRSPIRDDGTFLLEPVAPGHVEVVLGVGRGGTWRGVSSKQVELREGETASVDLTVSDVRVRGRVTRGGRPLANVEVELSTTSGSFSASMGLRPRAPAAGPDLLRATVGPDGAYEMLVPVAGTYRVMVNGLPGSGSEPIPPELREVRIPEAESFRLDLALPDWSFSGVVLASDNGKPIEGALVRAIGPGGAADRFTTKADGRFKLALAPAAYEVHVTAPKYVAQDATLDVAPERNVDRTFRLVRGGSVKARVWSGAGRPAVGAMVVAADEDGQVVSGARTEADGTVEVSGLTAGKYTVLAGSEQDGFALRAGVAAGETDVALTLSPPTKVRLTFRDEGGKPLVRTSVLCELVKVAGRSVARPRIVSYSQRLETDAQGTIEASLPPGEVDLVGYTSDWARRGTLHLTTEAAGGGAAIVLRPVQ